MVSRTWLSCGNKEVICWKLLLHILELSSLSAQAHLDYHSLSMDLFSFYFKFVINIATLTANIIYPPLCHWLILLSKIFVTTKRFYEGLNDKYLSHEIGNKKSYTNHSIIIQLNKFWEEILLKMTNKLNKNLWLHWLHIRIK